MIGNKEKIKRRKKRKKERILLYISELELLCKYASKCNFIIETGGGGKSTSALAEVASNNNAKMITIEIDIKKCKKRKKIVEYMNGWSITYKDLIKPCHPDFIELPIFFEKVKSKSKSFIDGEIAHGKKHLMVGEKDLIRKALKKYNNKKLDFFFCDTGEYCGLAEWNIVKDEIAEGGYFCCHDIYYPKSIKCFKIAKQISESDKWEILEKTKSKQGLLIARKIKK